MISAAKRAIVQHQKDLAGRYVTIEFLNGKAIGFYPERKPMEASRAYEALSISRSEVRDTSKNEAIAQSRGGERWRDFIRDGIQANPTWQTDWEYARFRKFGMGLWKPRWWVEDLTQEARRDVKSVIGQKPKGGVGLVIGYGGSPHEIVAAQKAFEWKKTVAVEFVNLWWRRRVEKAAQYLAKHGHSPKDFVLFHANAGDLRGQIPDASIDGVYAANVTLKLEMGGKQMADEIIRVLRPGGYAYISVQKYDYQKYDYLIAGLRAIFEPHGNVSVFKKNALVFQKSKSIQNRQNIRRSAKGRKKAKLPDFGAAQNQDRGLENRAEVRAQNPTDIQRMLLGLQAGLTKTLGHAIQIESSGLEGPGGETARRILGEVLQFVNFAGRFKHIMKWYGMVKIPAEVYRVETVDARSPPADLTFPNFASLRFSTRRIPLGGLLFFYEAAWVTQHEVKRRLKPSLFVPTNVPLWTFQDGTLAINLKLGLKELHLNQNIGAALWSVTVPPRSELRDKKHKIGKKGQAVRQSAVRPNIYQKMLSVVLISAIIGLGITLLNIEIRAPPARIQKESVSPQISDRYTPIRIRHALPEDFNRHRPELEEFLKTVFTQNQNVIFFLEQVYIPSPHEAVRISEELKTKEGMMKWKERLAEIPRQWRQAVEEIIQGRRSMQDSFMNPVDEAQSSFLIWTIQEAKKRNLEVRIELEDPPFGEWKKMADGLGVLSDAEADFENGDVERYIQKIKKQMELASNSQFAIIIAPKEYSSKSVVVRNMKDGTEKQ
ncbi:MAG: methyltransferase domain-containing protein, partial [Candidatus Aenigmarchaeota archaeon]|nr:methyltransferase domain-containing protein [Candidatus Aenigmarchaeota archaeon]